jgi:DNA gyrase subunit B
MAKEKKNQSYDESNIKVLKGLDVVRKKSSMYMGERGNQMVFQMVKEAVDNAYDEFISDRNDSINVFFDIKNDTYLIADSGNGIPVGKHSTEKISTLTVVMTQLHAGGKFDDKAYKSSSGTFGVGISASNALSKEFDVWTRRDNVWYHQSFSKGIPQTQVSKKKPDKLILEQLGTKTLGTIIRMVPDQTIVSEDAASKEKIKEKDLKKAKLEVKPTVAWLRNLALLNPGLKVRVAIADGKTYNFHNKKDIDYVLTRQVRDNEWHTLVKKPLLIKTDTTSLVLNWCSHDSTEHFKSYVNCSNTRDHGKHYQGLRAALSRALSDCLEKPEKEEKVKKKVLKTKDKAKRKAKQKSNDWSISDIVVGMVGFLNYRMSGAEFSSQTKERLTSKVEKDVEDQLYPEILAFFKKNKKLPKQLVQRAQAVSKGREELKKIVQSVSDIKKGQKGSQLPVNLITAPRAKPHEREMWVVEGDSAGGTSKLARNPDYQEIFKLTGKCPNAMRTPLPKLIANERIHDLLVSIGIDVKSLDLKAESIDRMKFTTDKLRIGKLMCLADGDSDGGHITVLILTLIYRLIPDMFTEGRVFVVDCPLYSAFHNNKRYFGDSYDAVSKQLPKGSSNVIITRAKGLGELNPGMLRYIAFDPEHQRLIKVCPPPSADAHDYFMNIVGDNSATRKKLLGLDA